MKAVANGLMIVGIGEIHAVRESLEQFPQPINPGVWAHITELSNYWQSGQANFMRLPGTPGLEIPSPDDEKVLIALAGIALYSANNILIEFARTMIDEYEGTRS